MTIYIGIDPDVDKSGFAAKNSNDKQFAHIWQYSFFDLIYQIELIKIVHDVVVVVEAGWLIKKSNWHSNPKQSKAVGEKIAKAVGANHQVGKLFVEWCESKNIECIEVKPMGKLNAREFKKITGWEQRTNPEQRDAAMLVFGR